MFSTESNEGVRDEKPPPSSILLCHTGNIPAPNPTSRQSGRRKRFTLLDSVQYIRSVGYFGRPFVLDYF